MISAPITGYINNILSFLENQNIDGDNVDTTSSDGIMTLDDAQTVTGLKTFENTAVAAGGIRTAGVFAHNPASGTPTSEDGVEVLFKGDNASGTVITFGEIECHFQGVSAGSEESYFQIKPKVVSAAGVPRFEIGKNTSGDYAVAAAIQSVAGGTGILPGITYFYETLSGVATAGDGLSLTFRGEDDAGANNTYGQIDCRFVDPTAGSETGSLDFYTSAGGAATRNFVMTEKNFGVGVTAFGTNGTNVIGITADGTVPSSSPAGMIQIFADDSSGGAANATLAIRTEEAVASEVLACDSTLNIWVNGVEYHLLMRAV